MRITDSYNSTCCFHKILFLAREVAFYMSTVIFLCKNIGFPPFLDFDCYCFQGQRGTVLAILHTLNNIANAKMTLYSIKNSRIYAEVSVEVIAFLP